MIDHILVTDREAVCGGRAHSDQMICFPGAVRLLRASRLL